MGGDVLALTRFFLDKAMVPVQDLDSLLISEDQIVPAAKPKILKVEGQ